ncbi:hypothetical protein KEM48_008811 [Puccinia striiformis f. sp. tritici PST-130]|nr:hypothetical protein H4Q26_009147 [Puccinia striiformis f. sp. tritici PST-130]KAI9624486.1 hypothetical protein KEM48_008811 [Puccinia striiformis f. sp. tritici PST-130]
MCSKVDTRDEHGQNVGVPIPFPIRSGLIISLKPPTIIQSVMDCDHLLSRPTKLFHISVVLKFQRDIHHEVSRGSEALCQRTLPPPTKPPSIQSPSAFVVWVSNSVDKNHSCEPVIVSKGIYLVPVS